MLALLFDGTTGDVSDESCDRATRFGMLRDRTRQRTTEATNDQCVGVTDYLDVASELGEYLGRSLDAPAKIPFRFPSHNRRESVPHSFEEGDRFVRWKLRQNGVDQRVEHWRIRVRKRGLGIGVN